MSLVDLYLNFFNACQTALIGLPCMCKEVDYWQIGWPVCLCVLSIVDLNE